jgi:membrane protein
VNASAIWTLMRATYRHWREQNTDVIAAALAYYTLFSLAPTLIVMIAVAGLVFGRQAVTGQLFHQIRDWVGPDVATTVQTMVASISRPDTNIILTVIGLAISIVGGSHLFYQLQNALNIIWDERSRPDSDLFRLIRDRFISFAMVLLLGLVLFLSLLANTIVTVLESYMGQLLPAVGLFVPAVRIGEITLSLVLSTLLFAFVYKTLPNGHVAWRDVWIGALMVAFVFTVTKYLFGLYVGVTTIGAAYGVAGSLLMLLLWVFYSVHIFLFGAAFTYVYAYNYGSRARQSRREHRVKVKLVPDEPPQPSPFSATLRPHAEVLPPAFRDLWLLPASARYRVVLKGELERIWQRPIWLRPLFAVMRRAGGLLAPTGRNVPLKVTITAGREEDGHPFHLWQRRFYFGREHELTTKIVFDPELDAVVERFGPRQMLQLVWVVRFRAPLILEMEVSDCVFHFRSWRSSLPRWAWLKTSFRAQAQAPHSELVSIRLVRSYWILGQVFGYQGTLRQELEPVAEQQIEAVNV